VAHALSQRSRVGIEPPGRPGVSRVLLQYSSSLAPPHDFDPLWIFADEVFAAGIGFDSSEAHDRPRAHRAAHRFADALDQRIDR